MVGRGKVISSRTLAGASGNYVVDGLIASSQGPQAATDIKSARTMMEGAVLAESRDKLASSPLQLPKGFTALISATNGEDPSRNRPRKDVASPPNAPCKPRINIDRYS